MKPLYPLMAAIAALATVSPSQALAGGPTSGTNDTAKVVTTTQKVAPNEIAAVLKAKPEAVADAGARIASFMLDADKEGKSFVAPGINRTPLEEVAKAWAKKEDAGKVAMLYFVAGPGKTQPDWAKKDEFLSKVFLPDMKWEQRLRVALVDWTGKAQIAKTAEAKAAEAFLNDAAAKAATVFADPRTTQEIKDSANANNTTGVVVPKPTGTGAGSTVLGAGQGYGFDDIYVAGAVVQDVYGPKDEGSRRISMKIYTSRDPETGELVNKIGVFDITDPNNVYGQRFSMANGETTIALDDRTEGHKKYTLKIETGPDGQKKIAFYREGGSAKDPGAINNTSVEDLLVRRADQAAAIGNVVNVGGKDYYVVPQGGKNGALSFLDKAAVDNRSVETARDTLKPELYVEVSKRNQDGDTVPIGGKPYLGKGADDKEYHLEYNKATKMWEVKEGEGDKPKPKPQDNGGGTVDTTKTTTGDNTGTTDTRTQADIEKASAEDFEKFIMTSGPYKKSDEDNKDISAKFKDKVRILYMEGKDENGVPIVGRKYTVIVPGDVAPHRQLQFETISKDGEGKMLQKPIVLQRVYAYGDYLILQFDQQQQYLDMNGKSANLGFAPAGDVGKETGLRKFTNVDAFVHALRTYVQLGAEDKDAPNQIPGRVKGWVNGKAYVIEGGFAKDQKSGKNGFVSLLASSEVQGGPWSVWPQNGKANDIEPGKASDWANLGGPTNAFVDAAGGPDKELPPTLDDNHTAVGTVQTDVALYATKSTPKAYKLMFRFAAKGGMFRSNPIEVFNDDPKAGSRPMPANVQMAGLSSPDGGPIEDKNALGLTFVSGSGPQKGVIAVYKNRQLTQENVTKKGQNCAGPVLWWGLADRDAALAACKADKIQ